jgi:cation diffusion facilitator CzcD-associated flavoprotein CzcO
VVTEGIDHVGEHEVVTAQGRSIPLDVLILATGFESTAFLAPISIQGLEGRSLETEWKDGARAYLGLTVAGFPNLFMMYGPNTNLGHNSIIFMIECQTRYILDCIAQMDAEALQSIELRQDVMEAYNRRLQRELARTVWSATDHSWYKTADGLITNNWSGSTIRYWWLTRKADLGLYRQRPRASRPTRAAAE